MGGGIPACRHVIYSFSPDVLSKFDERDAEQRAAAKWGQRAARSDRIEVPEGSADMSRHLACISARRRR